MVLQCNSWASISNVGQAWPVHDSPSLSTWPLTAHTCHTRHPQPPYKPICLLLSLWIHLPSADLYSEILQGKTGARACILAAMVQCRSPGWEIRYSYVLWEKSSWTCWTLQELVVQGKAGSMATFSCVLHAHCLTSCHVHIKHQAHTKANFEQVLTRLW